MEGRPPEEDEVVERARHGDARAYEEIVRGYQEVAFRVAYLVCGDAGEAEDAVQEAFVRAYRALPRFRRGAPLRPWLLTIVANEARNRRRAAARRATLVLREDTEVRSGDAAPSPEAAALAADRRAELLAAVELLREEERLVVACRFFLELSELETAAVLRIRAGTAKSRLSRALDRLRESAEVARA